MWLYNSTIHERCWDRRSKQRPVPLRWPDGADRLSILFNPTKYWHSFLLALHLKQKHPRWCLVRYFVLIRQLHRFNPLLRSRHRQHPKILNAKMLRV